MSFTMLLLLAYIVMGSVAYKAVLDGETVGGVIAAIDTETQHPLLCEYLWISHHRFFQ